MEYLRLILDCFSYHMRRMLSQEHFEPFSLEKFQRRI